MVEFVDGSIIAQMGVPDMKTPIQYALTYPKRQQKLYGSVDLIELGKFTFENSAWRLKEFLSARKWI